MCVHNRQSFKYQTFHSNNNTDNSVHCTVATVANMYFNNVP